MSTESADLARKKEIVDQFRTHEGDTGSAEVQIALLSDRIQHLTEHLKVHKKDHASRRGMLKMVGRRSAMVKYLAKKDPQKYLDVIRRLGIRR